MDVYGTYINTAQHSVGRCDRHLIVGVISLHFIQHPFFFPFTMANKMYVADFVCDLFRNIFIEIVACDMERDTV